MFYVGLDVHARKIVVCVLNEDGKVWRRCQLQQINQLLKFLSELPVSFEVCYEASTGYGHLYELLTTVAARVSVAHPGLLRLIFRSKRKNDRVDAEKLAKLLYVGEVPIVHVPSADVRAWRETITFRRKVIEKRTRAKNALRALLRTLGIVPPTKPGLWTLKGMGWLKSLEFDQTMHTLKRNMLVEEIESFSRQLACIEQELERFAKDNVAVFQLQSIPGVGPRTAEAIVAFIDDPHRFAGSKKVGAYFGLVPSQDQSGNTNRLGRITRDGSATVRHLLVEAAWHAKRRSPTVRDYFERMQRDDPERKKKAVVATAHYLARVMWSMMRNGTLWKETATLQSS